MKGAIAYFNADGNSRIEMADEPPTLEQLQQYVGGYIEVVRVIYNGLNCQMIINDEGLVKGLPRNQAATDMFLAPYRIMYPGSENPYKTAWEAARARWLTMGATIHGATSNRYEDDPHITGNVVVLEGLELE